MIFGVSLSCENKHLLKSQMFMSMDKHSHFQFCDYSFSSLCKGFFFKLFIYISGE